MKKIKYKFIINGKPITQSRPRFAKGNGDKVVVYDKCSASKAIDRITIMNQMRAMGVMSKLHEPLIATFTFHMGGVSKRSEGIEGQPKPTMPDVDNLVKYYLDMMNDLVYVDDRFVTEIHCKKLFSEKKRVEIEIENYGDDNGAE